MRYLQGFIEEAEIKRLRALSVRLGVAGPYGSKAGRDSVKQRAEILEGKVGRLWQK